MNDISIKDNLLKRSKLGYPASKTSAALRRILSQPKRHSDNSRKTITLALDNQWLCISADAFASVFQVSDALKEAPYVPFFIFYFYGQNSFFLSKNEVASAAKTLKTLKTAGVDQISSLFVKDCATVLSEALTMIFNIALKTELFPVTWKAAQIVHVFKAGNKSEIAKYRLVLIISNLEKVCEFSIAPLIYPEIKPIFASLFISS